jgi:hypothetical protein
VLYYDDGKFVEEVRVGDLFTHVGTSAPYGLVVGLVDVEKITRLTILWDDGGCMNEVYRRHTVSLFTSCVLLQRLGRPLHGRSQPIYVTRLSAYVARLLGRK